MEAATNNYTYSTAEMQLHIRSKMAQTALLGAIEKIRANHPEVTPDELMAAFTVAMKKVRGGDHP